MIEALRTEFQLGGLIKATIFFLTEGIHVLLSEKLNKKKPVNQAFFCSKDKNSSHLTIHRKKKFIVITSSFHFAK
jgi:hypothetical protein